MFEPTKIIIGDRDPLIKINRADTVRLNQIARLELVGPFPIKENPSGEGCWLNVYVKGYRTDRTERWNRKRGFILQTELSHNPDPECPIDPIELKDRIEKMSVPA